MIKRMVEKYMIKRITIKKLDHTGHSTLTLPMEAAYAYIENEIENGNLIYSPEAKEVFKNFASFMQKVGSIKEVIVIPPVVGG